MYSRLFTYLYIIGGDFRSACTIYARTKKQLTLSLNKIGFVSGEKINVFILFSSLLALSLQKVRLE